MAKEPDYMVENGRLIARTMQAVASALGCAERTVQTWYAKGAPRGESGYDIPALIAWARNGPWKPEPTGDPLMSGSDDDPWLSRYRRERTLQTRMERKRQAGELVPVHELMPVLLDAASVVRQAGETLGRQYGPEAQVLLNEAVAEFLSRLEHWEAPADAG